MNKVFLSGRINATANIAYTPGGERIYLFPFLVDGSALSVDVVYKDAGGNLQIDKKTGCGAMIAGELTKMKVKQGNNLRIEAKNIFLLEE